MPANKNGENNLLTSWKEIAAHLGVDERTCQRWEKKYGLPVRRMEDTPRSRVFAHKEDLDFWREAVIKNGNFVREIRQTGPALKRESGAQNPIKRYILLAMGILGIAVLLLIFIPRLVYDRQPGDFRIDHSRLVILNKSGKELWTFDTKLKNLENEIFYKNHFQKKNPPLEGSQIRLPNLMFEDINHDGRLEVLFSTATDNQLGGGELFCFNNRGKPLWPFKASRERIYGNTVYSADYRISGFIIGDWNNDRKAEILLIAHQWPEWPCQLVLLDHKGNIQGEYWNSGYFADLVFQDFNGDGKQEILVSGCNNEYKKGCLVVFDPEKMSGGSPQMDREFSCLDLDRGSEIFYILAPRTDVDMADVKIPLEALTEIRPLNNGRVSVMTVQTWLFFEFTPRLELADIKPSHGFDTLHRTALLAGKIKSELNKAYYENLKKGILYYDGKTKTWVNYPAMSNAW